MKIKSFFGTCTDVDVIRTKYSHNGNLAIQLVEIGTGLPYASLTVCLGDKLPPNYAYVDTNNLPGAENFITENGLGKFVGINQRSGFCTYPLYCFN